MTEFASVEENYPDSITCVCGNTCGDEGMIQCDEDGIAFHILIGDVPEGLAKMPDETEGLFMLCPSCGRVYSDHTIIETGTAPVIKTVDVSSGPVSRALEIHWSDPEGSGPEWDAKFPTLDNIPTA